MRATRRSSRYQRRSAPELCASIPTAQESRMAKLELTTSALTAEALNVSNRATAVGRLTVHKQPVVTAFQYA